MQIPVNPTLRRHRRGFFFSKNYSLNRIKSKTVGDGQHGTARWAVAEPCIMLSRQQSALENGILRFRVNALSCNRAASKVLWS